MEKPTRFKTGNNLVLRLKCRNWNNMHHKLLVRQEFLQTQNDYCEYAGSSQSSKIIIIVWADALIISALNSEIFKEILFQDSF